MASVWNIARVVKNGTQIRNGQVGAQGGLGGTVSSAIAPLGGPVGKESKYGTDSHEPERPRHRDRYCQEEAASVPSRPLFHRGGQEVRHGRHRYRHDGIRPFPHDWEPEDVRRCS